MIGYYLTGNRPEVRAEVYVVLAAKAKIPQSLYSKGFGCLVSSLVWDRTYNSFSTFYEIPAFCAPGFTTDM
jgi:hypothetical protein